ncbi:hypothetical protein [Thalassospira sp.]|uniref:hypothetical protein n=1 Tax=Thalassospira sp. TaxID=1912094 RepID=UPI000C42F9DD|nr:hypothetical protein [Thalassospira sp.]MAL39254.1 hypothetical protein [Thalassospira sp.]|tara:strand:- start:2613 stop:3608 length:996 start_codon:yes stop_codon:yes gene_type:complete
MQSKRFTVFSAALVATLLVSGCDKFKSNVVIDPLFANDPDIVARDKFQEGSGQVATIFGQFLKTQEAAIDASSAQDKKTKYYLFSATTIAASDAACDILFDILHRMSKDSEMAQGAMNMIGNATGATLGLLDASSEALGGLAIALGVGNTGFELFNERFMLTPALPALRKKVVEVRKTLANTLRAEAETYKSYAEAEGQLRSYHLTCSPIYLADIIAKSVEVAPFNVNLEQPDEAARVSAASSELYELAYGQNGTFTRAQLKNLAEVVLGKPGATATSLTTTVTNSLNNKTGAADRALVLLDSIAGPLDVSVAGQPDDPPKLANIGITVGE